ncbi:MAG TPA: hypothetical protein VE567_00005, partial [Sphingomonas sp.]|nr:hypothetical protein [Sphingomonas sp.]
AIGSSKRGRGAATGDGPGNGEGAPSIPESRGWLPNVAALTLNPEVLPAVFPLISPQPELACEREPENPHSR